MKRMLSVVLVMAVLVLVLFPTTAFATGLTATIKIDGAVAADTVAVSKVSKEIEITFSEAVDAETVASGITMTDNTSANIPLSVKMKSGSDTVALVRYGELDVTKTYTLALANIAASGSANTLDSQTLTITPSKSAYFLDFNLNGAEDGNIGWSTIAETVPQGLAYGTSTAHKWYRGVAVHTAGDDDDIVVGTENGIKYLELGAKTASKETRLVYIANDGAATPSPTPINTDFAIEWNMKYTTNGYQKITIGTNTYLGWDSAETIALTKEGSMAWEIYDRNTTTTGNGRIELEAGQTPTALNPTASNGYYNVKTVGAMQDDGQFSLEYSDMNSENSLQYEFLNFPKLAGLQILNYKSNSNLNEQSTRVAGIKLYSISPLKVISHKKVGSNYEVVMSDDIAKFAQNGIFAESNYNKATRTFTCSLASLDTTETTLSELRTDDGAFSNQTFVINAEIPLAILCADTIHIKKLAGEIEIPFNRAVNEKSVKQGITLKKDGIVVPTITELSGDGKIAVIKHIDLDYGATYTLDFAETIVGVDGSKFDGASVSVITDENIYFAKLDLTNAPLGNVAYSSLSDFTGGFGGGTANKAFNGIGIRTNSSTPNEHFVVEQAQGGTKYLTIGANSGDGFIGYGWDTAITTNFAFDVKIKADTYAQFYSLGTNMYSNASSVEAFGLTGTNVGMWQPYNVTAVANGSTSANRIEMANLVPSITDGGVNPRRGTDDFFHVRNVGMMQANGHYEMEQYDLHPSSLIDRTPSRLTFTNFPKLGSFAFKNYSTNSNTTSQYISIAELAIYEITPIEVFKQGVDDDGNYNAIMNDDIVRFAAEGLFTEDNYDKETRTFTCPAESLNGAETVSMADIRTNDGAFTPANATLTISYEPLEPKYVTFTNFTTTSESVTATVADEIDMTGAQVILALYRVDNDEKTLVAVKFGTQGERTASINFADYQGVTLEEGMKLKSFVWTTESISPRIEPVEKECL